MMADSGLVSNSGIGPNYQSVPSTRNKGGPNIVPLTPVLQYILFRWSDFILFLFVDVGLGNVCIEKRLALVTIVFIQITNGDSPNIVPLTPVPSSSASIHSVPARWSDFISRVCKIWCWRLSEKCVH